MLLLLRNELYIIVKYVFFQTRQPSTSTSHKSSSFDLIWVDWNVGYGGNESLESSVRVIFIGRHKVLADIYRREMSRELDSFVGLSVQENILKVLHLFRIKIKGVTL